jgi:surface antigen
MGPTPSPTIKAAGLLLRIVLTTVLILSGLLIASPSWADEAGGQQTGAEAVPATGVDEPATETIAAEFEEAKRRTPAPETTEPTTTLAAVEMFTPAEGDMVKFDQSYTSDPDRNYLDQGPGLELMDFESLYATGDDYPAYLKNAALDDLVDPWSFYNRECTSFVAWCLTSRNGISDFTNGYKGTHFGNANTWGSAARQVGIAVDMNPAVGSVAWSDSGKYGHVTWVSGVSGNNVTIEEYNYGSVGGFGTRTVNKTAFTGYIHIKDIQTYADYYGADAASEKVNYGDSTYQLFHGDDITLSYQRAEEFCESLGGHLAVIGSQDENDFLYQIAKDYPEVYFGLNDAAVEGTWVWANGATDTYRNWHVGEPDNNDYGDNGACPIIASPSSS